jgi:hypothetical protein
MDHVSSLKLKTRVIVHVVITGGSDIVFKICPTVQFDDDERLLLILASFVKNTPGAFRLGLPPDVPYLLAISSS